ncbi:MAG: hypothetical protein NVS3B26_30140 [Mycobacteriales bacterium]
MTDVLEELGRQLNRHDIDGVLRLLTPDVRLEISQLSAVWDGPQQVACALRALYAAVPDFTWTASHRYVGTSELTEEGVWEGSHTGCLAGYAGSGKALTVRARAVVDEVDGRVRSGRMSIDLVGMKLGMGVPVTAVEAASTAASVTQVQAADALLVTAAAPSDGPSTEPARWTGRRTGALIAVAAGALALAWGQLGGHQPERRQGAGPVVAVAQASLPATAGPHPVPVLTPIAGVTTKGRQVTLSADVLFNVASADLTPHAQEVIARVAALLASQQPHGAIVVSGYTDSTGDPSANQRLSLERAQAVVTALQRQAIVRTLTFQARGLGSSQSVATNATAAGRSLNRRVTIVLPPS